MSKRLNSSTFEIKWSGHWGYLCRFIDGGHWGSKKRKQQEEKKKKKKKFFLFVIFLTSSC